MSKNRHSFCIGCIRRLPAQWPQKNPDTSQNHIHSKRKHQAKRKGRIISNGRNHKPSPIGIKKTTVQSKTLPKKSRRSSGMPRKAAGLRRGFSRSGGGTGNFMFSSVAHAPSAQENPSIRWVFNKLLRLILFLCEP